MAIYRLISSGQFGPDEIEVMTKVYESAVAEFGLDRDDPVTELIARSIVNVTGTGERRPDIIKDRALGALAIRRGAAA